MSNEKCATHLPSGAERMFVYPSLPHLPPLKGRPVTVIGPSGSNYFSGQWYLVRCKETGVKYDVPEGALLTNQQYDALHRSV